jgi:histidinol dehydrogenase
MRILDWQTLDEPGRRAALARPAPSGPEAQRVALEVIESVRRGGDQALRALTRRFDGVTLESLAVTPAEFTDARQAVTLEQMRALERAVANVERFHQAQDLRPLAVETETGVFCEQIIRPITCVGLYVPAGSAPLPSTVIMLAVPARIAGCRKRILCTPPRSDGRAHPSVLVAAQLCGIDTVFNIGGAQAIAALAYGTESIPRVDKIFGPGNAFVAAAKRLVAGDPQGAPCDLPAGPSEVLLVADDSAHAGFVTADLLAQAEHDPLAQSILVTDCRELAEEVAAEIRQQKKQLSRRAILDKSLDSCRALIVPDLETAIDVANAYAPEHLILQVREPRHLLAGVRSAGSVFLGPWSPETLGDYCSGPNHVLPTGGSASSFSGLAVRDFVKVIAVQEVSPAGLRSLGPTAITLASLEGLDAHANAVTRRLAVLDAASADATAGVAS